MTLKFLFAYQLSFQMHQVSESLHIYGLKHITMNFSSGLPNRIYKASKKGTMLNSEAAYFAVSLVTLVASLPGNIFILAVNIVAFAKKRKLSLSDQLILGIVICNLLHGLQKCYRYCVVILRENVLIFDGHNQISLAIYLSLMSSNLWITAWLCVHFCLKIVNVNHKVYIYLQRRFVRLCPWIILLFILGSFFVSLYVAWDLQQDCLANGTQYFNQPNSYSARCFWSLNSYITVSLLCFLLCLVSAMSIIISLFRHVNRIQHATIDSSSPSVDFHIRAIKTVTSLLILHILLFISVTIALFTENDTHWLYGLGTMSSLCYLFSSYVLIKGTKKMDNALHEMLSWFPCYRLTKKV